MTKSESEQWDRWFQGTVELVNAFIDSYDERDHDFARGLTRGWMRGLIAGLERMIHSVDLPEEIRNDREQTVNGLTVVYEQITGIK